MDSTTHEPRDPSLAELEARRLQEATWCLRARLALERATDLLAATMGARSTDPVGDPVPPAYWRRSAVLNLAAVGLRSARAALTVICTGYAPEALGLGRLLAEVAASAQLVLDDTSGERARLWLTDDRKLKVRGRKAAQSAGRQETFDLLSQAVHADPRAAHRLHEGPPNEEGRVTISVAPGHARADFSDALLAELANDCVHLARLVAAAWDEELDDPANVAGHVEAIRAGYGPLDQFLSAAPNPYVEPDG